MWMSALREPQNKLYFRAEVTGLPAQSNVWVHVVDAHLSAPACTGRGQPGRDARDRTARAGCGIQILWPHGSAPVNEANLANISVDLFRAGTLVRLAPAATSPQWSPEVWLVRALNNDPGERIVRGVLRLETAPAPIGTSTTSTSAPRVTRTTSCTFGSRWTALSLRSSFWTHGLDADLSAAPGRALGDCSA